MSTVPDDQQLQKMFSACGLDALGENPNADAIETCLSNLGEALKGESTLRRAIARSLVIKRLSELNVEQPGKLVDVVLGSHLVQFPAADLYPLPVDGALLLNDLADCYHTYVVVSPHAAIALALWTLMTWCVEATDTCPILGIASPTKRCGKTTLLIVLNALARRPLPTSNISPAALFRVIHAQQPTLLFDEVDTQLPGNEELRSILNAGHTRATAKVIRTVPVDGSYEPREFSVYGPKVLAGIGTLPGTVEDRSIRIPMRRKAKVETVSRLRQDRIIDEVEHLRSMAARWSQDHLNEVKKADPEVPLELHDRARDNWRPLIAIADAAGGPWSQRARHAALSLTGDSAGDDAAVLALSDLRDIFAKNHPAPFLLTQDILAELVQMEERPWPEWRDGKPLSAQHLAKLLKPFGVHSEQTHLGSKVRHGYRRDRCEDAFLRYLEPKEQPAQSATSATKTKSESKAAKKVKSKSVKKPLPDAIP